MKETKSDRSEKNPQVRTGKNPGEKPKPGKLILRLAIFFLMYIIFRACVETLVTIASLVISQSMPDVIRDFMITGTLEDGLDLTGNWTVIVSGIAFVAAGLMILGKAKEYDSKYTVKKEVSKYFYPLTCAAAVGLSLFINMSVAMSGISAYFSDYTETAATQYSCAFIVGIIVYGFISPVSEELMFRGILYNGLKRLYIPKSAMIMCAAIFAIYHGNGLQGTYGFIISLFLIYSYEFSGQFKTAVLIHMVCNITAYVMNYVYIYLNVTAQAIILGLSLALAGASIYLLYKKDMALKTVQD
jgi:membrane protease YdiL (CAAX protease family)